MLIRRLTVLLLGAATGANGLFAGYLFVLTCAGARRARTEPSAVMDGTPTDARRFSILVPAHDEEQTIGRALESFRQLDYPPDRFDVHVVADNCTDRTADVVTDHGWTVHVRVDPDDPGKGPALNWLLARLDAGSTDVVVIIDADTSADANLLRALDRSFRLGAIVAQANYSVRDHDESTNAALRYAALTSRHHLRPLARNRLGASAGLYGNGMAFDQQVLRRHRWTGHLTEDADLQLRLLIEDGIRVRYVPDAKVAAEMPDDLVRATSQNERWERGRLDLVRTAVPQLFGRLVGGQCHLRRTYADAILDLLTPPLSVHASSLICTTAACAAVGQRDRRARRALMALNVGGMISLALHVGVALWSVDAPASAYRSLLRAPRLIVWKTLLWLGTLADRGERTWLRTTRNIEPVS